MKLATVERRTVRGLEGRLPGADGQLKMSPHPRFGWRPGYAPRDSRHGAALLLLFPVAGRAHLLLTVRDRGLPQHAGQVSLPGGAVERGESYDQAALREAREEVGLDPGGVRVLGALSPLHVPASGFVIHPRVGVVERHPRWEPDPREVARVLEVPLESLTEADTVRSETRRFADRDVVVPLFAVAGEKVWGATAMILAEYLTLIGTPPPAPPPPPAGPTAAAPQRRP